LKGIYKTNIVENNYRLSWGQLATLETPGLPSAPVLVALHGWLDNAASFIPLMESLPEYKWIAVDLAGHGHSNSRPGGNLRHLLSYMQDLWELIALLGHEQINLVGHSLGTGIAGVIAATQPSQVNKLVLIDGMGPFSIDPEQLISTMSDGFSDHQSYTVRKELSGGFFSNSDQAIEHLCKRRNWPPSDSTDSAESSHRAIELIAQRQLKQVGDQFQWAYDQQLKIKSALPFNHEQANAIYENVMAQTLIFRFSEGPMHDTKIPWQQRLDALKQKELIDLEGNHHLHMFAPEQLEAKIRDFIET